MEYKSLGPPIFLQALDPGPHIKHIRAPTHLQEDVHNDVTTVDDVFIASQGPFAIWNYGRDPVLVAESANYDHLFDSVAPKTCKVGEPVGHYQRLPGDYALLANVWSATFYHWFEELLRVVILEDAGFQGRYIIHQQGTFIPDSLELLGISPERFVFHVGDNLVVERLWITARTGIPTSLRQRPNLFYRFRSRLLGKVQSEPGKRLFLIRGEEVYNHRDVVNRDAVLRVATAFDYEAVDLGKLPFREQVALAASSTSMMGMHGAAFCHTSFMPRRSTVVEFFSPIYINYSCLPMVDLLAHRYVPLASQVYETYPHGVNSYVDTDVLRTILNGLGQ